MTPTAFASPQEGELINLAHVERMIDADGDTGAVHLHFASGKILTLRGDVAARVRRELLFWHGHYNGIVNAMIEAQQAASSRIVSPIM
jgi:hypothetical protein